MCVKDKGGAGRLVKENGAAATRNIHQGARANPFSSNWSLIVDKQPALQGLRDFNSIYPVFPSSCPRITEDSGVRLSLSLTR